MQITFAPPLWCSLPFPENLKSTVRDRVLLMVCSPIPNFWDIAPSERFLLIAGPCSVESHSLLYEAARSVKAAGAQALRGGLFKMRTHPDSFQGLGQEGFAIVERVKAETALPFVCEITDPRQLSLLDPLVDVFQVGARNMHNFELLKELGRQPKTILLKRGLAAYLEELLAAAEYISREGNSRIILCERGIRTFEQATRNTLDLSAVPYLQQRSRLPVIVDPSHGTGYSELVVPMAWAACAAGADGLILEVHPQPSTARSDSQQALTLEEFARLTSRIPSLLRAVGDKIFVLPKVGIPTPL